MEEIRLEEMSDDRLLEGVEVLVRRSNETTAELLAYLAEVDGRRLYRREACTSMFAFCVERLHMSESAAGRRITAARTARRFPVVLEMIARGEVHLTAVNLLGPHLTEENHAGLLARARHRGKREIERLVAEIAPRPDVVSRVVAVRRPAASVPEVAAGEHAPERAARPAVIAALAPRRYEIRVTVDQETHDKLRQLQDLQVPGGRDPAVIVARAIEVLLEQTLARKAGLVGRPRAVGPAKGRTRHIPAAVRREVWKRDGARCAFVDDKGRRCSATASLEFHHRLNWARGAGHEAGEIELRCRAHNLYQAELDYGAELISARRDGSSRAGEARNSRWVARSCDRSRLCGSFTRSARPVSLRKSPGRVEGDVRAGGRPRATAGGAAVV